MATPKCDDQFETSQGRSDPTTVEELLDLGDGLWFIVLTKKEAETVASLEYDPKEREFPPKEEKDQIDPYGPEIVEAINNVRDPFRPLKD